MAKATPASKRVAQEIVEMLNQVIIDPSSQGLRRLSGSTAGGITMATMLIEKNYGLKNAFFPDEEDR